MGFENRKDSSVSLVQDKSDQKGNAGEPGIWSSILSEVVSGDLNRLPSSKQLVLLGDSQTGKTTLVAKLQGNEDPKKGAGLEYAHILVKDEYRDVTTRLSVWTLDGDPAHARLLKFEQEYMRIMAFLDSPRTVPAFATSVVALLREDKVLKVTDDDVKNDERWVRLWEVIPVSMTLASLVETESMPAQAGQKTAAASSGRAETKSEMPLAGITRAVSRIAKVILSISEELKQAFLATLSGSNGCACCFMAGLLSCVGAKDACTRFESLSETDINLDNGWLAAQARSHNKDQHALNGNGTQKPYCDTMDLGQYGEDLEDSLCEGAGYNFHNTNDLEGSCEEANSDIAGVTSRQQEHVATEFFGLAGTPYVRVSSADRAEGPAVSTPSAFSWLHDMPVWLGVGVNPLSHHGRLVESDTTTRFISKLNDASVDLSSMYMLLNIDQELSSDPELSFILSDLRVSAHKMVKFYRADYRDRALKSALYTTQIDSAFVQPTGVPWAVAEKNRGEKSFIPWAPWAPDCADIESADRTLQVGVVGLSGVMDLLRGERLPTVNGDDVDFDNAWDVTNPYLEVVFLSADSADSGQMWSNQIASALPYPLFIRRQTFSIHRGGPDGGFADESFLSTAGLVAIGSDVCRRLLIVVSSVYGGVVWGKLKLSSIVYRADPGREQKNGVRTLDSHEVLDQVRRDLTTCRVTQREVFDAWFRPRVLTGRPQYPTNWAEIAVLETALVMRWAPQPEAHRPHSISRDGSGAFVLASTNAPLWYLKSLPGSNPEPISPEAERHYLRSRMVGSLDHVPLDRSRALMHPAVVVGTWDWMVEILTGARIIKYDVFNDENDHLLQRVLKSGLRDSCVRGRAMRGILEYFKDMSNLRDEIAVPTSVPSEKRDSLAYDIMRHTGDMLTLPNFLRHLLKSRYIRFYWSTAARRRLIGTFTGRRRDVHDEVTTSAKPGASVELGALWRWHGGTAEDPVRMRWIIPSIDAQQLSTERARGLSDRLRLCQCLDGISYESSVTRRVDMGLSFKWQGSDTRILFYEAGWFPTPPPVGFANQIVTWGLSIRKRMYDDQDMYSLALKSEVMAAMMSPTITARNQVIQRLSYCPAIKQESSVAENWSKPAEFRALVSETSRKNGSGSGRGADVTNETRVEAEERLNSAASSELPRCCGVRTEPSRLARCCGADRAGSGSEREADVTNETRVEAEEAAAAMIPATEDGQPALKPGANPYLAAFHPDHQQPGD